MDNSRADYAEKSHQSGGQFFHDRLADTVTKGLRPLGAHPAHSWRHCAQFSVVRGARAKNRQQRDVVVVVFLTKKVCCLLGVCVPSNALHSSASYLSS